MRFIYSIKTILKCNWNVLWTIGRYGEKKKRLQLVTVGGGSE